jgi:hypothetical protein
VVALRYVYVLALSIWFGGSILIGVVAPPVSAQVHQRLFVVSSLSGGILLLSLMAMALLGPRPSGFAARFVVALAMFATTLFAGRVAHALSTTTLAIIVVGGLALLFWEARDGTRAA